MIADYHIGLYATSPIQGSCRFVGIMGNGMDIHIVTDGASFSDDNPGNGTSGYPARVEIRMSPNLYIALKNYMRQVS